MAYPEHITPRVAAMGAWHLPSPRRFNHGDHGGVFIGFAEIRRAGSGTRKIGMMNPILRRVFRAEHIHGVHVSRACSGVSGVGHDASASAIGGIMVRRTPEQAREIVNAVKYAPLGKRGVGLGSSITDFLVPDPAAYFREANENTTVITMIESPLGLANAGAIAATEGVDVLWVAISILTASHGIPAQFHHAQFLEALRGVIAAARSHGKVAAINPSTPEQAEEWSQLGFHMPFRGARHHITSCAMPLSAAISTLRARVAKAAAHYSSRVGRHNPLRRVS